jgi:murein DD-endopeptidase MepM/ murein hydrolase activator NlpD
MKHPSRLTGQRPLLLLLTLLALTSLGCGVIGYVTNPAPLTGLAYWAAQTSTAVPTVTVFLGWTTPVYAATAVPEWTTTTPEWTTVTPVFLGTPTPYWVTTTPLWITNTPESPITTTPALPQIGYSTPEPTETPYYRIGSFYMHSDVYLGGPDGLALRLIGHESQPSPHQETARYHYLTFRITQHGETAVVVPLADLLFIRRVQQGEQTLSGRWTAQNEPLLARGLPGYDTQATPLEPGTTRELVIGFVTPAGEIPEVGMITDWQRPVEGGLPIWFYLTADPTGPWVDAVQPPPPTPGVLDSGGTTGGGGGGDGVPGGGHGMWPTTGVITRGYGCHELYTGVDGAGFDCPAERPWFHNGVDIANSSGTAIWSPVAGAVVYAGPNSTGPNCADIPGSQPPHEGLGNYQRISGEGTLHYLGHLSSFGVTEGSVTAGQTVAGMGSTGCSTGSHLHWMVYQNGALTDPAQWAGPQ